MKITLKAKNAWDTVAFKVKDTDNDETMRRRIADKLKAKENRAFAKKYGSDFIVYRIEKT